MIKLPRHGTASQGTSPEVVGPGTALAQVLRFYEREAHHDPSAAWRSFTTTWNWAAPLPAALPTDHGLTIARSVPGGFSLSGVWRMPWDARHARWLAVPLVDHRQRPRTEAAKRGPDVFVLSSNALPRPHRTVDDTDTYDPTLPLDQVYVPGGFATSSAGTPLRSDDAAFVRTAVTAMALGSARRLTDALTALDQQVAASPVVSAMSPAAAAAELAAVLHDERLSLAVHLHGTSPGSPGAGPSPDGPLAASTRRASHMVHEVVAAVYEYGAPFLGIEGHDSLVSLIESSTPVLQCMRFAVELLPPGNAASTREGSAP
ncbi:hypothetical protein [Streptomyces albicerus]|uniref:hypothetical protein n=1 Tax=Streptomyces albicerus TaxID=2569859 RepID=UPI00124B8CE4|nr:hypothetical protein [Streptomyces albicerus]